MKALRLHAGQTLSLDELPDPPRPGAGEVRVRMRAVALNHIDLWGHRGMAFVRRTLPIVVGVEGAGTVEAVGPDMSAPQVGSRVAVYGGHVCGVCRPCRGGRENLCEQVGGIMGFHVDGLAAQLVTVPARLAIPVPKGVDWPDAACAPLTFATVQHMLFDNARLQPGESILVQAGGSGIGSTAVRMAKAVGATVFATVGSEEKRAKVLALGADHAINYRTERVEGEIRRLTGKRGVDVVFEHVGPDSWSGSLMSLARGGRLVICGCTTGVSAATNLQHLFQQQIRIIASFGASFRNVREGLAKMAAGTVRPVIDGEIALEEFGRGLERLAARDVFGKIVVRIP